MSSGYRKVQVILDARARRALNNLMGIVDGITCDGVLSTEEISYLDKWLDDHSFVAQEYPANVITRKLREVVFDGIITVEEKAHLLTCLQAFSSHPETFDETVPAHISRLFDDDPSIFFEGRFFVLTGEFFFRAAQLLRAGDFAARWYGPGFNQWEDRLLDYWQPILPRLAGRKLGKKATARCRAN